MIIPDSFKDSISSEEIIEALSRGIHAIDEKIKIVGIPASDGGEGFLNAVKNQVSTETIYHDALDPIGRPVEVEYLLNSSGESAYIELAMASGLECLDSSERNPMFTTTVGTGLQILHAINKGARKVFIGLGGSATNDGGIGLAGALGYSFQDATGETLLPVGMNLERIESISGEFDFPHVQIIGVADVTNPLIGKTGAAFIYAPQKGASESEVNALDSGLLNLSNKAREQLGSDFSGRPGAGAAGGAGYGLMTFLNAQLVTGMDFFFELSQLERVIEEIGVDLIITGEGKLDNQSLNGKLISGLKSFAKKHDIPIMAICGQLGLTEPQYLEFGIDYVTEIAGPEVDVEDRIKNASRLIENIASVILSKFTPR
ncbi:MAG: glycerate kinase [Bacteroidia bacterium]|nr:glycerate kinase [Bacteroidia bacterium]